MKKVKKNIFNCPLAHSIYNGENLLWNSGTKKTRELYDDAQSTLLIDPTIQVITSHIQLIIKEPIETEIATGLHC